MRRHQLFVSPHPPMCRPSYRFNFDRLFRAVVDEGRGAVEDLVHSSPHGGEEQDVLPALADHPGSVDRQQIAGAGTEQRFEQVAVSRAEVQARAVGQLEPSPKWSCSSSE